MIHLKICTTETKIEDRSISNIFLKDRHNQIIPRFNSFLVPDSNMAENADASTIFTIENIINSIAHISNLIILIHL